MLEAKCLDFDVDIMEGMKLLYVTQLIATFNSNSIGEFIETLPFCTYYFIVIL